ncbi:DinB family protein [Paenibacillus sp. sgz500958]|uniref:DinB family protein n=1 Tax=Paenibacillus sp. sgz500958 TaxID=3242475 RepID=UPI0036D2E7D7
MCNKSQLLDEFKKWNSFILEMKDFDWTTSKKDGQWTIHDIVSHIMLWDKYFFEEVIERISTDKPLAKSLLNLTFDEFNKNSIEHGKTLRKDELIELTMKYRNLLIDNITNMDELKFTKGYFDNKFTVEGYLKDFIWHDQHHMKQMEVLKK